MDKIYIQGRLTYCSDDELSAKIELTLSDLEAQGYVPKQGNPLPHPETCTLEIGKIYKFRDDIDNKRFPFGHLQGEFIGYTKSNMPRFKLNDEGRECFVNATDENFVEVKPIKPQEQFEIKEMRFGLLEEIPKNFDEKWYGLLKVFENKINEIIKIINTLKKEKV